MGWGARSISYWIPDAPAAVWNDGGEATGSSFQTREAFIPSFQTGEAMSGIQRRTVSSGFQRLLRNFGMTVPG